MSLLENHFYHKTINLYSKVFGTVFNNLKIKRDNDQIIPVPIMYASGQKYNKRMEENEDPNLVRFKQRLPRMSFQFVGFQRDVSRATNKNNRLTNYEVGQVGPTVQAQYNRVPYLFNYRLDLKAKYLDDMLQMIEQISVAFSPSIQVVVQDNPDIGGNSALTLTLEGIDFEDDFEGTFESPRVIEASMTFSLAGYLYRQTTDTGVINEIIINYHDLNSDELLFTDTVVPE